jgi:hypothetical protein
VAFTDVSCCSVFRWWDPETSRVSIKLLQASNYLSHRQ